MNITDGVSAPIDIVAAEVAGNVEEMDVSEEKDFPAKILEISDQSPPKEIVKTDAEKDNFVVEADKLVNGTNGVSKMSNGCSEVKKTFEEKDISNGDEACQEDGEESTLSTNDDILEDDSLQKESEDSSNISPKEDSSDISILPKEETTTKEKEVSSDQSTEEEDKEEEESAIGDKQETSPVANGVHDPISGNIEDNEGVQVDANDEETGEEALKEQNIEEEEKRTLEEKGAENEEDQNG